MNINPTKVRQPFIKKVDDIIEKCNNCNSKCKLFRERSCDKCHQHIEQNLSNFYTCKDCSTPTCSFDLCETCFKETPQFVPSPDIETDVNHEATHTMIPLTKPDNNILPRAYSCLSCKEIVCEKCINMTAPIKLKSYNSLFRRVVCKHCTMGLLRNDPLSTIDAKSLEPPDNIK